jgi:hypothetical protein
MIGGEHKRETARTIPIGGATTPQRRGVAQRTPMRESAKAPRLR